MFLAKLVFGTKRNKRRIQTKDLVEDQVREMLSKIDQKLIVSVRN